MPTIRVFDIRLVLSDRRISVAVLLQYNINNITLHNSYIIIL